MTKAQSKSQSQMVAPQVSLHAPVPLSYRYWPFQMSDASTEAGADEPILILVHDMASSAETFAKVGPMLTRFAHVVAVNQRGHGGTPLTPAMDGYLPTAEELCKHLLTVDRMSGDLVKFVTHCIFGEGRGLVPTPVNDSNGTGAAANLKRVFFGKDPRPVHVLGHGWGSRTAFGFAAKRPDLARSIICEDCVVRATCVDPPEDGDLNHLISKTQNASESQRETFPTKDAAQNHLNEMMGLHERTDFSDCIVKVDDRTYRTLFHPSVALAWNRSASVCDATPVWTAVKCPMLLLVAGGGDSAVPIEERKNLQEDIDALRQDKRLPRRMEVVGGARHFIHDSNTAEFVKTVSSFISGSKYPMGA